MFGKFVRWLTGRSRRTKQMILVGTDAILFMVAVWLSYSLRLNSFHVPSFQQYILIFLAPIFGITVLYYFDMYRAVTRYLGDFVLWAGFKAITTNSALWSMVAIIFRIEGSTLLPRSVIILFWLISFLLVIGTRYMARWLLLSFTRDRVKRRAILVYGAGVAGRQIASTLADNSDRNTVFQVDDEPGLWGTNIDGQRIYSPHEVPKLIQTFGISEAIVTMRTAKASRRSEIVEQLNVAGLRVRILPAFLDIADGKHTVSMIRDVDIGDLLGRDVVPPDRRLMGAITRNKVVLVTGAGGSIGSELCRQVIAIGVSKLVMLDTSELALYAINQELSGVAGLDVVSLMGSVTDAALVRRVMSEHCIDTVFHAAAYKHVPLVEANPLEGTRNNVLGTWIVASAAYETGVRDFVLISTDKAVRPTNVMGASKRLAEMIIQDFSTKARREKKDKAYSAVRFGNVVGSSGSVIPLFRMQIQNGGPLTLTHSQTTRYFMSIEEASQLVIQAGSLAREMGQSDRDAGRIFLLDMGEPIRIRDLAIKMIQLSNLTVCDADNPAGDIAIQEIGLRPGEKLHEELFISVGTASETSHPKITVSPELAPASYDVDAVNRKLLQLISNADKEGLMTLLQELTGMTSTDQHG